MSFDKQNNPPTKHNLMAFLYLLSILSIAVLTTATTTTITLPLSPFTHQHPSTAASDPFQILSNLASASLSRARHLKRPKPKSNTSNSINTPLFPHSYGGYTIFLSFGTPPQSLPFIMDTGSSLVWFPCTHRYSCSKCDFPNVDPAEILTFIPKESASTQILGCKNPKCEYIFGSDVQSQCRDCDPNSKNCTQACPPYIIQYGLGSTGGILLLETLDFPQEKNFPNFLVGCSVFSMRQPAGIAGFGRSSESLPSQLGVKKFSYCLVPRVFDDTPVGSNLVLETGSGDDPKIPGLSYTPFHDNPNTSNPAFKEYYYVTLRKIFVGNKHVKVPYRYLVPGSSDGNGGTIVDSGSTFTFMEKAVFDPVAEEFEKQMANFSRATTIENRSGLKPCFNISGEESGNIPELIFQFKGGAKITLPPENYFAIIADRSVICLTVVTDGAMSPQLSVGPAIILGSFQQQNYYVEYDLANKRFGFVKQDCV